MNLAIHMRQYSLLKVNKIVPAALINKHDTMIDLYEKKLKIKVAVADPMTSPKKTNDPKAPIYTSIMPRSLLIAVMADGNAP